MRALESFAKRAKHKKEFLGLDHLLENEEPIKKIVAELLMLESKSGFDMSKCWFLFKPISINQLKRQEYATSSSSYGYLFKNVLPDLKPSQRIAMGLDYNYYVDLSEAIHSNVGSPKRSGDCSKDYMFAMLQMISIVAGQIVLNLTKILKSEVPKPLKDLEKILIDGFDHKIYKLKKKKISVSDYVLVNGLILARAAKVTNTKYGYQSVVVDYIDETGLTFPETSFSSDKIAWLFDQSKIEKDFRNIIKEHGAKVRMSKQKMNEMLDKQVNELWYHMGAREHFFGDNAGAKKKIEEYLAKK